MASTTPFYAKFDDWSKIRDPNSNKTFLVDETLTRCIICSSPIDGAEIANEKQARMIKAIFTRCDNPYNSILADVSSLKATVKASNGHKEKTRKDPYWGKRVIAKRVNPIDHYQLTSGCGNGLKLDAIEGDNVVFSLEVDIREFQQVNAIVDMGLSFDLVCKVVKAIPASVNECCVKIYHDMLTIDFYDNMSYKIIIMGRIKR